MFVVLAAISAIASLSFLAIRVPAPIIEPQEEVKVPPSFLEVLLVFKDKKFLLLFCSCACSGLGKTLFYGSFTALIHDPVRIGFFMCLYGITDGPGSLVNGWLASRLGKTQTVIIGSISILLGSFTSILASLQPEEGNLVC